MVFDVELYVKSLVVLKNPGRENVIESATALFSSELKLSENVPSDLAVSVVKGTQITIRTLSSGVASRLTTRPLIVTVYLVVVGEVGFAHENNPATKRVTRYVRYCRYFIISLSK
jgi:hypothetical protein